MAISDGRAVARRWSVPLLGVAIGIPYAYAVTQMTAMARRLCDVDGAHPLLGPVIFTALLVATIGMTALVLSGHGTTQRWLGALGLVVFLIAGAWLVLAYAATPEREASPICERNVPPTWPGWLLL
jgi:hypothetical protein